MGSNFFPTKMTQSSSTTTKATSKFAKPIRFDLSCKHATLFLTTEEGWTEDQFDEFDWPRLNDALSNKPDVYKMWLSKQYTGHFGTRVQVGYYLGRIDGNVGCPNCGGKETASHLCL